MASMKQEPQCVLWCHNTNSPVTVQQKFRNEYGRALPDVESIKGDTGCYTLMSDLMMIMYKENNAEWTSVEFDNGSSCDVPVLYCGTLKVQIARDGWADCQLMQWHDLETAFPID